MILFRVSSLLDLGVLSGGSAGRRGQDADSLFVVSKTVSWRGEGEGYDTKYTRYGFRAGRNTLYMYRATANHHLQHHHCYQAAGNHTAGGIIACRSHTNAQAGTRHTAGYQLNIHPCKKLQVTDSRHATPPQQHAGGSALVLGHRRIRRVSSRQVTFRASPAPLPEPVGRQPP